MADIWIVVGIIGFVTGMVSLIFGLGGFDGNRSQWPNSVGRDADLARDWSLDGSLQD
jgi:hypothetical protein